MHKYNARGLLAVLLSAVALATATVAWAQTNTTIGPTDAIGFDYIDADLTTYTVTDFQVSWDNGAFGTIGLPPRFTGIGAPVGSSTYKITPPFSSGTHTVTVRVCNTVGCSGASSPFGFALLSRPATAPGNVRRVPR